MTEISTAAQAQLKDAVDEALTQSSGITPLFGSAKIPDLSGLSEYRDEVLAGITAALTGIDAIQKLTFLLPPNVVGALQVLETALTKVRGWLD